MFSSTIHQLPSIHNYEAAHKYFTKTNKPPRSKKWQEYQRPLKDTSSTHYRIERGNDGEYYDLVLYSTSMARYYAPDADGTTTSYFIYHDSMSSKQFMWHVLGNSPALRKMTAADGRTIAVPYHGADTIRDDGDIFTLKLVRDTDGRVLTERSWHPQMYKFVETESDKAVRRAFEEQLQNVLLLSAMRMHEHEANFKYVPWTGGFAAMKTTVDIKDEWDAVGFDAAFIQAVFDMGQDVYNFLRSKRHVLAGGRDSRWDYKTKQWHAPIEILGERITEKEFLTSLKGHILKKINMKKQRGALRLPKWMSYEDYPRTTASGYLRGAELV